MVVSMENSGILFHAVIVPHRSLSRRGLRRLMAVITGCFALTVLRLVFIHAWPVIAFSVGEAGLALVLLGVNARGARASEMVILTEHELAVTRTDATGRRTERRLSPAWLNVVLEEQPGQVPRLLLAKRGVSEEIGKVLGEAEKRDLARALKEALWKMRNPVFDNPQLREEGG